MAFQLNQGFGSGVMWATPSGANPTPFRFGTLQEVTLDFQYSEKELYGEYQLPVLTARGTAKVSGKAKFATFDAAFINSLFFDESQTTGASLYADSEGPTAVPTTPFQVTVTNNATWLADLGVVYANGANAGAKLTRVSVSPTVGQYSVAAGVYTFASADNVAGAKVTISYRYSAASGGFQSIIANKLLGDANVFALDLYQRRPNSSQIWGVRFYQCIATMLSLALKLEDFTIPDFSFKVYTDGSNNLGEWNLPN